VSRIFRELRISSLVPKLSIFAKWRLTAFKGGVGSLNWSVPLHTDKILKMELSQPTVGPRPMGVRKNIGAEIFENKE